MLRFFVPKLFGIASFLLILTIGCDRPEIPQGGYGQQVDEYPEFPNGMKTLPLPEEVSPEKGASVQQDGFE